MSETNSLTLTNAISYKSLPQCRPTFQTYLQLQLCGQYNKQTIISHSIPRYISNQPTHNQSLIQHIKAQNNKPWDSKAANAVVAIDEDNRIEDIKFVQNVSGMAHVPVAEYCNAGLGEFEIEFKSICSIEYAGYRLSRRHYVLLVVGIMRTITKLKLVGVGSDLDLWLQQLS